VDGAGLDSRSNSSLFTTWCMVFVSCYFLWRNVGFLQAGIVWVFVSKSRRLNFPPMFHVRSSIDSNMFEKTERGFPGGERGTKSPPEFWDEVVVSY
jgi:hypothetical protein